MEFLGGIVQSGTQGQTVRLSPAYIQPIASDDVAAAMADFTLGAPVNGTVEIAGPEKVRLPELVQRFLTASKDPRKGVADPQARYFGAELKDDTLVPAGKAWLGSIRFEEWFAKAQAAK